ncbi:MAG: hypothetical protein JO053_14380 [Acidobacteria bacterium]|nr:hypothetical protein [Acidobacteriota bacterium]
MNIRAILTQGPPPASKVTKQLNYGSAVALTKTAKEGQAASVSALKVKFTLRNRWFEQQTPLGIKITPATPATQFSEVKTAAYFLPRQDQGGTKIPYKKFLAIPIIPNARPSKTALIPSKNLPKNLKNAFELVTKTGTRLLCIRNSSGRGRGKFSALPQNGGRQTSGLVPMYILVKKSTIKSADVFHKPIELTVKERLPGNMAREINLAFRQMR